jgi:hypothetical protein
LKFPAITSGLTWKNEKGTRNYKAILTVLLCSQAGSVIINDYHKQVLIRQRKQDVIDG